MNLGAVYPHDPYVSEIPVGIRKYATAHGLDVDSCASDGWYAPASTLPIRLTAANTGKSGPHDPPTFLTWQLRTTPGGTTLRLQVDEIEGSSDDDAEDTSGECPQVRDRSAVGWAG